MALTVQESVPESLEGASSARLKRLVALSKDVTCHLEALLAAALARECPPRSA